MQNLLKEFRKGTLDVPLSNLVLWRGTQIFAGGFGRLFTYGPSALKADLTVELAALGTEEEFRANALGKYTAHIDDLILCRAQYFGYNIEFRFMRPDWRNLWGEPHRLLVTPLRTEFSRIDQHQRHSIVEAEFGEVEFPIQMLNSTSTKRVRHIKGEERYYGEAATRDWYVLESNGVRYHLETLGDDGGKDLSVLVGSKESDFTPWRHLWVWKSAISFLTGQPLTVCAYREKTRGQERVHFCDQRPAPFTAIKSPLAKTADPSDIDDLLLHLLAALNAPGNSFLVGNFQKCWDTASNSLYIGELAAATAFEGITSSLYQIIRDEIHVERAALRRAKKAAKAILDKHLNCDEESKRRLKEHVGQARYVTGKEEIEQVFSYYSVPLEKKDFEAWKDVRNSRAHGKSIGEDNEETRIESYMSCLRLLYRITFAYIGYRGASPWRDRAGDLGA